MQTVMRGIVVRMKSAGDDRLLTLLTDQRGVIQATARGANKPRSRLASSTELFCYSRLTLFCYRDYNTVDAADVENSFFPLRNDLTALALASYIAELIRELAPVEEPAEEYLRLLLNTLYLIQQRRYPLLQLKATYELRLLGMAGFMPDLTGCTVCGSYEDGVPMYFYADEGCLACQSCGSLQGRVAGGLVSPGVIMAMRHILYSPFEKIFSFALPEEGVSELSQVVERYLKYHLQRSWRSLTFFYSVL
ncbi:MAG: DNA repair protein RecO [Oscillospiraceae bacterium]|nr:MAG: DNA repair protein RecO [Oscillospiraceae bacterium]